MTTLSLIKPPEDDKPSRATVTSEHLVRAWVIARALCEAEHGPGSTLAGLPTLERSGLQFDAVAALRRRNTVARNLAVYKAAETGYTAYMDHCQLSHRADFTNAGEGMQQLWIKLAAAMDTTLHGTLSGELDGGR